MWGLGCCGEEEEEICVDVGAEEAQGLEGSFGAGGKSVVVGEDGVGGDVLEAGGRAGEEGWVAFGEIGVGEPGI